MSHVRVLICRVEESDDEQMTELACVDLPPTAPHRPEVLLDQLEETVAERGCHILRYLYELAWEEVLSR